ncbi:MAG: sorbosone dehydrogenase family protein [Rhodothermia bacterium]|nr:sorbosone dehydrogenase family protein [Rhodothermia bacterium]
MRRRAFAVVSVSACCVASLGCSAQSTSSQLHSISLPDGFTISVYADSVAGARSLELTESGTLFIGTRGEGSVYAVRDEDGDGEAESRYVIASGLQNPNGVAFLDGDLFVAEVSKIWRYRAIEDDLTNPPQPELVTDRFPTDRLHGWKYIAFGPDGKLYVQVGAPCNVCEREEPYASITRMNPDGSGFEIFARGVRNTVGFTWHPETSEMWFTDNGRDMMGDDLPPDELNHAPEIGMNFGFPYVHGGDILDPEFGDGADPSNFAKPVQNLEPHVAALGLEFYTAAQFPEEYRGQVFIAEHGSWNRTEKIGYRVSLVRLDDDGIATSYEPFAEGWLQGESNWGRPVDLELAHDGSLLVSDDQGGVVYRISYTK